MHATAHGGCMDTTGSLHWKLTLGEKSLAAPWTRTRISTAPGFSVGHSTNWAMPAPSVVLHHIIHSLMPTATHITTHPCFWDNWLQQLSTTTMSFTDTSCHTNHNTTMHLFNHVFLHYALILLRCSAMENQLSGYNLHTVDEENQHTCCTIAAPLGCLKLMVMLWKKSDKI